MKKAKKKKTLESNKYVKSANNKEYKRIEFEEAKSLSGRELRRLKRKLTN